MKKLILAIVLLLIPCSAWAQAAWTNTTTGIHPFYVSYGYGDVDTTHSIDYVWAGDGVYASPGTNANLVRGVYRSSHQDNYSELGTYLSTHPDWLLYDCPVSNVGGTTTANASTTIVGSGTAFSSVFEYGDRISLSSAATTYSVVTAVTDDTHLTVDVALGDGTSQTINKVALSMEYDYKGLILDWSNADVIAAHAASLNNASYYDNYHAISWDNFMLDNQYYGGGIVCGVFRDRAWTPLYSGSHQYDAVADGTFTDNAITYAASMKASVNGFSTPMWLIPNVGPGGALVMKSDTDRRAAFIAAVDGIFDEGGVLAQDPTTSRGLWMAQYNLILQTQVAGKVYLTSLNSKATAYAAEHGWATDAEVFQFGLATYLMSKNAKSYISIDPDYEDPYGHKQAWNAEYLAPIGYPCGAMTQVESSTAYIRSHSRGVSIVNINSVLGAGAVSVTLPTGSFTDLYGTPVSSPVSIGSLDGLVLLLPTGALCGDAVVDPAVTTGAVSNLAATSLTIAGNVTDDGGDSSVTRKICYGTAPSPTSTCTTTDGTGEGAYSKAITGLSPCTVYYLAAKAENTHAAVYGSDVIMRTRGACATGDWTNASSAATIAMGTPVTTEGTGVSSKTLSVATTSVHTAIMCGVTFQDGAARTITAFSRNSQDFTNQKTQLNTNYSAAVYSLLSPTSGTYDVSVTFSDTVNVTLSCVPVEGPGSFNTPGGDNGGQSDPTSIDAASGTGQVVFDVVTANNTQNPAPGESQTQLSATTTDGGAIAGETSYRASAGATTNMTWTIGAGIGYLASSAVAMIPGTVDSSNWYTSATVKPYSIKASGTLLTHVADDASCPASIDAANKWCHKASENRVYARVTGDGNPGTVTIQCSPAAPKGLTGLWQ